MVLQHGLGLVLSQYWLLQMWEQPLLHLFICVETLDYFGSRFLWTNHSYRIPNVLSLKSNIQRNTVFVTILLTVCLSSIQYIPKKWSERHIDYNICKLNTFRGRNQNQDQVDHASWANVICVKSCAMLAKVKRARTSLAVQCQSK